MLKTSDITKLSQGKGLENISSFNLTQKYSALPKQLTDDIQTFEEFVPALYQPNNDIKNIKIVRCRSFWIKPVQNQFVVMPL